MSRGLDAPSKAKLDDKLQIIGFFVELDFLSGTVYLWTGHGDYTWNNITWRGLGDLFNISKLEETKETMAKGMVLSLNGLRSEFVYKALNEVYRGRRARIYACYFERPAIMVGTPWTHFEGKMDKMNISTGGETSSIMLYCENRMIDLGRPNVSRYTDQEQQKRFPGDKGCEYMASLAEKEFKWGKA